MKTAPGYITFGAYKMAYQPTPEGKRTVATNHFKKWFTNEYHKKLESRRAGSMASFAELNVPWDEQRYLDDTMDGMIFTYAWVLCGHELDPVPTTADYKAMEPYIDAHGEELETAVAAIIYPDAAAATSGDVN
jgi:hypothetical protein